MRLLRFFLSYVLVSIAGVLMLGFLALNRFMVKLDVFGPEYSVSVAWVMVGATVLGFALALLLLGPAHIATIVNGWRLNREIEQLEDQLAQGHEQHARLLAQHEYLMEGHQRMLLRHQRLVVVYGQVAAERDQARAQLGTVSVEQRVDSASAQTVGAGSVLDVAAPVAPAPAPDAPAARVPQEMDLARPRTNEDTLAGRPAPAAEPERVMVAPVPVLTPLVAASGQVYALPSVDVPRGAILESAAPGGAVAGDSRVRMASADVLQGMRKRIAVVRDGIDKRIGAMRMRAESARSRLKRR
jgi:hypothetical protein